MIRMFLICVFILFNIGTQAQNIGYTASEIIGNAIKKENISITIHTSETPLSKKIAEDARVIEIYHKNNDVYTFYVLTNISEKDTIPVSAAVLQIYPEMYLDELLEFLHNNNNLRYEHPWYWYRYDYPLPHHNRLVNLEYDLARSDDRLTLWVTIMDKK